MLALFRASLVFAESYWICRTSTAHAINLSLGRERSIKIMIYPSGRLTSQLGYTREHSRHEALIILVALLVFSHRLLSILCVGSQERQNGLLMLIILLGNRNAPTNQTREIKCTTIRFLVGQSMHVNNKTRQWDVDIGEIWKQLCEFRKPISFSVFKELPTFIISIEVVLDVIKH
jgi:hypothetical protein